MSVDLKNRHFLDLTDFNHRELQYLIDLARRLKAEKRARTERPQLEGKNIASIVLAAYGCITDAVIHELVLQGPWWQN